MAEKTFNTRIALKVDTLVNWEASTLVLKKGEVAFATIAASAGVGLNEPVVMIKVGDGTKTFKQLPWSLHAKSSDVLTCCKSEDSLKAFVNSVIASSGLATDGAITNLSSRVTAVENASSANTSAISTLNGAATTAGSVANKINAAISALNLETTYAAKTHNHEISDITNLSTSIADAKKAGTDAQADVDALEALVGDTAVSKQINNAINAIPKQVDYSLTVTESTPTGYAKAYKFSQNGKDLTTINIPKDMVVSSGKVVTNPKGQTAGTYIELTLANATSDKIYINVSDLIEYVTGDTATDGIITIAVDANHKATATINDGTITLAKLTSAVQTEIGKAHSHGNKAELDKISSGDKAKWDGAVSGLTTTNGKVSALEAKVGDSSVASQISTALDSELAAIAKSGNINDLIQTDGDVIVFDCGTSV